MSQSDPAKPERFYCPHGWTVVCGPGETPPLSHGLRYSRQHDTRDSAPDKTAAEILARLVGVEDSDEYPADDAGRKRWSHDLHAALKEARRFLGHHGH